MRNTQLICLSIFLCIGVELLFSQNVSDSKGLMDKAIANLELMRSNPQKAFVEAGILQKEAMKLNDHKAELYALSTICIYYKTQIDFKNLIASSEILYNKADAFNQPAFKAIAKDNLSNAYIFIELYEKAFEQLEQGLEIINTADGNDSLVIDTKSNLYVSFSNYYSQQNDNKNQLKYIKLSIIEHEKFRSIEYKKRLQYIDYSNLAIAYYEKNLDSAEIYARKSVLLSEKYGSDNVNFCNFITLGSIYQKKGIYKEALSYFHLAEEIKNYKNHLNVESLYQSIISVYIALRDTTNIKKYEDKLATFKLSVSENKNESLHKIIEEKEQNDNSKTYQFLLIASIVSIGGLLFFVFSVARKNFILAHYEKTSHEYLEEKAKEPNAQVFIKLIEMARKNDLAFISSFHEVFPDFSKKLQTINPKIVQTEIEFCALLKLNIPTKEIARHRNIEHRTVQNKKYLIRKKLNIPKDIDIYFWFSNL